MPTFDTRDTRVHPITDKDDCVKNRHLLSKEKNAWLILFFTEVYGYFSHDCVKFHAMPQPF
ncbi:TPA: hypothetical protein DDW35_03865 [Candidatus Sumerlaeota bacterium]|nr:hypothetical protein [Candidatus Sumerlaeota bacterium]